MIYPINIKKKIKESRHLKENVRSVASVAAWLKDSIAAMTANQELTISRRILDSNFGFYVYWTQGFDINDDSVIHADADKSYGLVAALKCRNDAEWDGEYMDSPYDSETGDLYCEDYELSPNDNTKMVAEWLLEDYNSMIELMNKNPEIIIGGLKESKSIKEDLEDIEDWEDTDNYDFEAEYNQFLKEVSDQLDNYGEEEAAEYLYMNNHISRQYKDKIAKELGIESEYRKWTAVKSKSIKESMNWTTGEEEYEIDSTLASAPINSIIFIKKSYGGKTRTLKFEKVATDKWDSLNKFNDRTSSYESDKSLKDKYIDGATWKLEKAVNESKSIKEAPDNYGLPTDDELETKYRAELDKARSERDLLQNAHEQELFDSNFLEELENWLKEFTDMNKDAEYLDIIKNNSDLFNCDSWNLSNLIKEHNEVITWLTYAIKALKGNKYYYHKWANAPFVYYTGGFGSPVGLVRRNVKAIFKEIPSYFYRLVDLLDRFHRKAYAPGGGSNGGYSKVLTALISDERVDYKLSTFEKFKDWLDNNGIFIKQRYNFKYNQASWNEFIVTSISNSAIQLNRLKSFDTICAKFASEFPGWTLHFSRIQNGSDRGKVRGSFSRDDRQYTNYTDTDYENDIVTDDTVEPAAIKSNADVNNANIVTIVKDSGKLRAQADDGEHGVAFVAFPNNLRNTEGQRYKVDKLIWNGKNYRASGNIEAINESKSIKESSDDIFANNMEEFCNKLDLEYKWGGGIFYPKWDAYNEFRNKLDAAGLKDTTFWYFQGSNPDKGRGNPDANICVSAEDEDSYAMVEVYKFPIYKKSIKSIKEGLTAREILDQAKALLEK